MLGPAVLRERRTDGVAGRIIHSEALRDRPFHDGSDPLADGMRGRRFRMPQRQQDGQDLFAVGTALDKGILVGLSGINELRGN